MYELKRNEEVERLIAMTKSDSGVCGPRLVEAHRELGRAVGAQIGQLGQVEPEETTVVAVLRGGIFFAEGMYLAMGCRFGLYDPKHEKFVRPGTRHVILVDSVINTGRTLKEVWDSGVYAACCVVNERAVPMFGERLFAVRVSGNSFVGGEVARQVGSVGPDTTLRLFHLL